MKAWANAFGCRVMDRMEPTASRHQRIRQGMLAGLLVMGGWFGAESLNLPHGTLADIGLGMLIILLLYGLTRLIVGWGQGVAGLLKRLWTVAGLSGVLATVGLLAMIGLPGPLALGAGLVFGLVFLFAAVGVGLLSTEPKRFVAGGAFLLPAVLVGGLAVTWLLAHETDYDPVTDLIAVAEHDGQPWVRFLEPGPYLTDTLTYGSGSDRWRQEYASQAAWQTGSVDARDMLNRPSGFGLRLRERFWGFGLDALPINGRVWFPLDARERLPLVLVVHGNHDMMDFSDPGYAWLGEHLASRGHVVVSVDQNFVNSAMFGGLSRENGVRGWLLLQHLAAWRQWQQEPTHPLHELIDLNRVVLIGHSRGGEAAALAAAFNRLERYPEDARIEFDFNFGIQGVAAIAPVDGQFWASGKPTELSDVSYFVIHGGMDGDVHYFSGDRQLVRTRPDPVAGRFSSSLYVHHANHGQFNTEWGDNDTGMIAGRLLNRAWLMSGDEQRQVGLLYLTAFVENANARPESIPALFCNPGVAGRLLPATVFVTRCDDGRRQLLTTFEQGIDITRSGTAGVSLSGRDLDLWAEKDIGYRGNTQRRQTGVFLGWDAASGNSSEQHPSYRIDIDAHLQAQLGLGDDSVLWLDMAQADRDPPPRLGQQDEAADHQEAESVETALRPPIGIVVVLEDSEGTRTQRPLSDFSEVLPPLPVRHTRLDLVNRERYHSPTEPLLQSVAIPLSEFVSDGLRPERLQAIELQFDNSDPGVLIIERIGITPGGPMISPGR